MDVLSQIGFAAPSVLAGPQTVRTDSGRFEVLVMTRVQGLALPWINVSDVKIVDRTCRLLFDAIDNLHGLTEQVANCAGVDGIPRRTLDQELAEVLARKSPWAATRIF